MKKAVVYNPDDAAQSIVLRLETIERIESYISEVAKKYRDIGPFWEALKSRGADEAVRELLEITVDGKAR